MLLSTTSGVLSKTIRNRQRSMLADLHATDIERRRRKATIPASRRNRATRCRPQTRPSLHEVLHLARPIGSPGLLMKHVHPIREHLIRLHPCTRSPVLPRIEATRADLEHLTHTLSQALSTRRLPHAPEDRGEQIGVGGVARTNRRMAQTGIFRSRGDARLPRNDLPVSATPASNLA